MTISEVFRDSKVIAVVGLSPDPSRSSYSVAERMQRAGYTIVPVNPLINEWNGLAAYPSVSSIPSDIQVDIVDIFRREEFILDIIKDSLTRIPLPKCVWLQQDLYCPEGRQLAEAAGVTFVEDSCLAVKFGYYHTLGKTL
ncbi:MAG: CoA-binding protein [Bacteroidetes bacterium]|nr:CoA-binding protein [Bacteroidota bacterium]